jgi:hypothetical protein
MWNSKETNDYPEKKKQQQTNEQNLVYLHFIINNYSLYLNINYQSNN